MEQFEIQARAAELEQQIANLPAGSITKKIVNGKAYFYHRWTENKKRREKYIPTDELENFRAQIAQRKELEQRLKALKKQMPKTKSASLSAFTTPAKPCVPLRHLFSVIAGARASGSCMSLSTASRRTRYSFSAVCAGQARPP